MRIENEIVDAGIDDEAIEVQRPHVDWFHFLDVFMFFVFFGRGDLFLDLFLGIWEFVL